MCPQPGWQAGLQASKQDHWLVVLELFLLLRPPQVHSVAMTVVAIPPQLLDTFAWCMIT